MIRKLIELSLNSPLVVILFALALAGFGTYAFLKVNVEAYPDPAPAIIEIVAQNPGASAEEMERLVTIPLEVALAGMPGLTYTRSKSLAGLTHIRNQFEYNVEYYKAKQEVINRLQTAQPTLPQNVVPQISPFTPTGELMRYTISTPKDALGREIYTLNDIKAMQDWVLQRQFKRIPRIADVTGFGGTVKRYEIHPDPDQMHKYGMTLAQLSNAISNCNANVGADLLRTGNTIANVRGIGLIGGGHDPAQLVLGADVRELEAYLAEDSSLNAEEKERITAALTNRKLDRPLTGVEKQHIRAIRDIVGRRSGEKSSFVLRAEEERRLRDIRTVVLASVNNVPFKVDNMVDGGPILSGGQDISREGVVVGHQTRLGQVGISRPARDGAGNIMRDKDGNVVWSDEDDKIQGIVLMRKNEETLPALDGVKSKLDELNGSLGKLLPGTSLVPHFDLTFLINVTTETVRHNLFFGMSLVVIVLLMFLSNVRSALIVAINVPLALLFAFSVLYLRGKSANLLSIGAVDFGIIVDSSVIMVENIYRHISAGEHSELPLKERILRACNEVERALFFSTVIMVCAFIPLFTMQGPEGQIFGPMADTYAFALGGALLLALTVAPALCLLFFRGLKPSHDNFLVRWLKNGYLRQLEHCLNHPYITMGIFFFLTFITFLALPFLGREFMPELEEGNLYVRGTFPVDVSREEVAGKAKTAREIMRSFPEVASVASQVGRPDDGTDPSGFYNAEFSIALIPEDDWPTLKDNTGLHEWFSWYFGPKRSRTKPELVAEMNAALRDQLVGVDWGFSQYIRDNVMESLSGVKGDNSVKIIGPELDKLEDLAVQVKNQLEKVSGVKDVGVFRIMGQPNLEIGINREAAAKWNVNVSDVQTALKTAVGGQAFTQMVEGERTFDVTLRYSERLRGSEAAILNTPVDVSNTVTSNNVGSLPQTPLTGSANGVSATGANLPLPAITGNYSGGNVNPISNTPRRKLRDLVTPVDEQGRPDLGGPYIRPGASTISREQGNRLIAIKFSVRGRDLAGAVAEAQAAVAPLIELPYRTEWSGEFQEMQEAEHRLMFIIPLSLLLVFMLLYFAFHSVIDALLVFSNVLALSLGGVWALLLTGTNFSISAAVGFISIFGVAIMDGLLLVSYFNHLRALGLPLREAIMQGAEKRVRPVMMTALTAIFGLLPAALSTRIGAQTQQPLAIVVVGGMTSTLLLTRYLMPVLYSFYGHREPVSSAASLAH
jgi:cobalt-zinc-cadmium resistance protein CzcA